MLLNQNKNYKLNVTHSINISKSNVNFVINGQSDYKILLPAKPQFEEVIFAAEEIKSFVFEATGADIEVIYENEDIVSNFNETSKFIVIGECELTNKILPDFDKKSLMRSGYKIFNQGKSVFLVGGGDFGTLYAAYEFLHHQIGFECYTSDEIAFDKVDSLKLCEFDITDIPDFTYRMSNVGEERRNSVFSKRMRMNSESANGNIWMSPIRVPWHNTFGYLPPETYRVAHPKWYSDTGEQLCFYAHGDEMEYKALFDTFMKKFIEVIEANPKVDNITITQQDRDLWCECDACKADFEKYGTNAATIIKFCNKVSDTLADYFEKNGIERNINICFFAYHKTTNAPVIIDSQGQYKPIDSDVICRDNVYCFYAPIYADFIRPLSDPVNRIFADNMDKWFAVSKKMYLWIYSTHFNSYFSPMETTNAMQENYMFAKAHGVDYLFDQSQFNNGSSTDWIKLKAYLNSKLAWNVQADIEELTNGFFENYYKFASSEMRRVFDAYRDWFEKLKHEKNLPGGINDDMMLEEYCPKETLDMFLNMFEKAYESILFLKNENPELYSKLFDRICLETLVYRYYQIKVYSSYYSKDDVISMKEDFKNDVERLGIDRWYEMAEISKLWESWNI